MWLRRDWGCLRLRPAPDRPQAPAGLGMRRGWAPPLRTRPCPCGSPMASIAGQAVGCRAPSRPCRSKTGLKRRPGYWVSRCVRRLGRAGPHRGTSSQTAGCGVSRFKAAEHGSLLRGHPGTAPPFRLVGVSPPVGGEKTRPSPIDLCGERERGRWSLWRGPVSVTAPPPLRRLAAYETVGWGRVGVPPQQTAHTAVLKRLTPHHAVCEEVPRHGPTPPTHRRYREPHSPAGV